MRTTAPVASGPSAEVPRQLLRNRRPLKAWRYAGLYTDAVMLCAGRVRIGGVPQQFWAVWDRASRELVEHTGFGTGDVDLQDDHITVSDRGRGVRIDLELKPFGDSVEVTSPHGRSSIWTRKWLARATGEVTAGARTITVDAPLLIDDSAGHHARATDWEWSAGFGRTDDGAEVAWNLVAGIHDADTQSERTVWVDGVATEVGPVSFTGGLGEVASADGLQLEFATEATRERHDRLGLVRSDYIQPFGTFTGVLPAGARLESGHGVMERHAARW